MVGRIPDAVTRWLLVCALAFAVVVMHHVATASHAGAGHSPTVSAAAGQHAAGGPEAGVMEQCCSAESGRQPTQPAGDHDLLHLCLAVLFGLLVVVTALVAWRFRRSKGGPAPPRPAAWSLGPPPPLLRGGRATLHSVCVLRL